MKTKDFAPFFLVPEDFPWPYSALGTLYPVPCTRHSVLGTRHSGSRTADETVPSSTALAAFVHLAETPEAAVVLT